MGKHKGLAGEYTYSKKPWADRAARGARKHGCKATVKPDPLGSGRHVVRVFNCPKGV